MRTLSLSLTLGGVAFVLSAQLSGCNAVSDDCNSYASCPDGSSGSSGTSGSSGSGGTDGDSGAPAGGSDQGGSNGGKGGAPAGGSSGTSGDSGAGGTGSTQCDTTKSPRDEACLVSDEFAVFVAPSGDDKNAGTQAAPFATLTKAAAAAGDLPVLVCDATYDEHVTITKGVRIFGGFKCTNWSTESAKPSFKPSTAGPALKIDTVADPVVIDGVGFEVGDAVAPGATALTAIVNASPKVSLRAVSFKAGKGKSGANGAVTNFTFPVSTELDGNSAIGTTGGLPHPFTCPGGVETSGGGGGTGQAGGQAGGLGTPDLPGAGGEPGMPGGDCVTGVGRNGANAPDAPAASGAQALGTLTAVGWSSGSGGDGQNGSPGQGGGGGASSKTGGGGGGGAGACGGAGARGGQGGGGSVALAVLGSVVSIESSDLVTADAGDGGGTVAGQPGDKTQGGFAGNPGPGACQGGAGGLGGDGGAGGGGAGGVSVGILWKGIAQPTVSANTTIVNGKLGAKGIGGAPGVNDGIAGVAQKLLQVN